MDEWFKSSSTWCSLLENLSDFVLVVDRDATIRYANRDAPGMKRQDLWGACGFGFIAPEHKAACQHALHEAILTGLPQTVEALDVFAHRWACRVVPLIEEDDKGHNVQGAIVICAEVTQQLAAAEAIDKEQRLSRQWLDLHERERRSVAYEIHDGFAQQLTGALFRLQGFRETHARNSAKAWHEFDTAVHLISRAIDDTRRLISGLRPPILDESGIIPAIEYLVCESERPGGPTIEFTHDVAWERLPPRLESTLFRIAQESLRNACRHSHSDLVRIEMAQRGDLVCLDVRDWGVGFSLTAVGENHFGLQGIRERARLLGRRVTIESAPGKGTQISAELPLTS